MTRVSYLICVIAFIDFTVGDYHCRRKGFSCQNGGSCNSDGSCACPSTHNGFDCSLQTSEVDCDDDVCENSGICYNNGQCLCSPDFYGDKCQYKTVSTECLGTEVKMTFVAPDKFSGEVYVGKDEVNCKFNQVAAEIQGYRKYTLNIPFNADNECSKTLNETSDKPAKGDISRAVDVVVSYNPMFISSTDSIIMYSCVHKGSNFTMFAELDDVGLDERQNLKKNIQAHTYSPVRFVVLDEESQPLNKSLYVGDKFKLLFFLADTSVYQTLSIDYCIANNTMSDSPVRFEFVKNGCPTKDGMNIMVNPKGPESSQYTRLGGTIKLPATEIMLYAFKFKKTTNVGFNCAVRICKTGDEEFCQPRDCSNQAGTADAGTENNVSTVTNSTIDSAENSTATTNATVRRKRSSTYGNRQLLSTIVTVEEPDLSELLILPNIDSTNVGKDSNNRLEQENNKGKCALSDDVIVVIVVLATVVFVLIVIASILTVMMCRNKGKIQILKEKATFDFNYTIPRPKLHAK